MSKRPRLKISVIVATYNRARQIDALIDYFCKNIELKKVIELELVIVDNNSDDNTKDVVTSKALKVKEFKLLYSFEGTQGLSYARNNGIESSSKEWLFFLDDDALPENDFFIEWYNQFSVVNDTRVFCCRVITHHESIPGWISSKGQYKIVLPGTFNCGSESRFLSDKDDLPIGSSLIINRNVFKEVGIFNVHYGYNASKFFMIGGEDTDLINRIKAKCINIYYLSNCIVNHFPVTVKTRFKNLIKIYFGQGYYYGTYERKLKKYEETRIVFPLWYYKELASTLIRTLYSFVKEDSVAVRYYFLCFIKVVGRFYGYSRPIV